jgi:hypothetical protein
MVMPRFSHVAASVCALVGAFPKLIAADDPVTVAVWQRFQVRSATTLEALSRVSADAPKAAAGVNEISFSEFLAPAGDGGLEFTPRLRSLAGKRVLLAGYMVRQAAIHPGVFVLAPQPVTIETQGVCFVAEIPAHAVHVHASGPHAGARMAYRPGRLVLTGVLELGPRREADGRNSAVRLVLDEPTGVSRDVSSDTPGTAETVPTS